MRIFVSYFTPLSLAIIFLLAFETRSQTVENIETAVWPLPLNLRNDASIMTYNPDGTLRSLRLGKNGFFCIPDNPNDDRFSVECHPQSLRAYLERRRQLLDTENRALRDSLLTREIQEGKLELPVGAISYFTSGKVNPQSGVPDSVMVWSEIALPFAGTEKTGLTTENAGEAPWIMRPNQYGAHVMIGFSTIAWDDLLRNIQ